MLTLDGPTGVQEYLSDLWLIEPTPLAPLCLLASFPPISY